MNKMNLYVITFFALACTINAQDVSQGKKMIENENYNKAKIFFNSLTQSNPKNAEAFFYYGEIYFIQQNYDSAGIFYQKGITANPDYGLNYAGLAKLEIQKGTESKDESMYEKALDVADKKDAKIIVALAKGYEAKKNYDKALELLNNAIKINPKLIDSYIEEGSIYLGLNNGTNAMSNYQKALDYDSTSAKAYVGKGKVYSLIRNYDESQAYYDRAIHFDPDYATAYKEMAELNYILKNYPVAVTNFQKYIELSGEDFDKIKRFASFLYMNKDYDKATEILNNVLKADPNNVASLRLLAYTYSQKGDAVNGVPAFNKFFEQKSAEFTSVDYEKFAELLSKNGSDSLAVEALLKAVELDSTRSDLRSQIAVQYFKIKNWPGVITQLSKKGNLNGQELFDLGKAYYFAKDTLNADTTFGRLIAARPTLAVAYQWRARINASRDTSSELGLAKPYYEQFIELAEKDTTARYKKDLEEAYSYLGYYYFLKSDKQNSLLYWQKVLFINPENEAAKRAVDELRKQLKG